MQVPEECLLTFCPGQKYLKFNFDLNKTKNFENNKKLEICKYKKLKCTAFLRITTNIKVKVLITDK